MVPRGAVLNTLIDFDFFERVLILAQFPVSFMARSKKVENGHTARSLSPAAPSSPDKPTGPLSIVIAPEEREVIKVNNANVTELKNSCDDAVKRYLSRPELFNQIHLHTDVRLGLGWASVFVAGGTAFYGYKFDFEKSKPVVWVGLILYVWVGSPYELQPLIFLFSYFFLTLVQSLYAYFIEGEIVYVGKRKTFSRRIVSERITLTSRTIPAKASTPPSYNLSISYVRSASNGKSLLAKGKTQRVEGYNAFFDEEGTMDQERFEKWVGELVEEAMEGKQS
ncbi:microsomal signal peptidase 25 kDa subunit-domain-containing protein [Lentinula lateritia]|uniref:Signal peptidase complex subunit 2 n=1 Tax=Lentinula lateritia TaxID=40482 RepID=A0ABQ8V5A9_9AGAR|nr:microsomal signal peptidase 25 kDa subunit-domain-containing protein [Lentinula lateritia]